MADNNSLWKSLTSAFSALGQLLAAIGAGGVIGWVIGLAIPTIAAWSLLFGFLFGLALGSYQIVKSLNKK